METEYGRRLLSHERGNPDTERKPKPKPPRHFSTLPAERKRRDSRVFGTGCEQFSAETGFSTIDSPGVDGDSNADDHFGTALAAGDFTGDGFMDLAIGIPRADTGSSPGGGVSVLHGSVAGITAAGNNFLVPGTPFDVFGAALAVGDFTGDGKDDLAVGAPGHPANGGRRPLCGFWRRRRTEHDQQ